MLRKMLFAGEDYVMRSRCVRSHHSDLGTSKDLSPGPEIGLDHAEIDGRCIAVRELIVVEKPFGRLLRFAIDLPRSGSPILIVAPLSGMRAGILYDMTLGLLPGHDIYCLAWRDAADVPAKDGPFGLEDNITYVVETIRHLGGRTHVVGLCQSALPALAATAILATEPVQPATLTLLGGKLATNISPTRVDLLMRSLPLVWFENYVVATVPAFRRGHGRHVYPGCTESMMLSTYLLRHCANGGELFAKLLHDDGSDASGHPFSRIFFEIDDVPAEFFLDTVAQVFHRTALADGQLTWQGAKVAPERIKETALLTIEGEMDDISGLGQTRLAHDLCSGIPAERREHLLCARTGHIGLFFGSRWRQEILPHVIHFMQKNRI